jgi:hypothetical protein
MARRKKLTPLAAYRAALTKRDEALSTAQAGFAAARDAAVEEALDEAEKTIEAHDSKLPPKKRLEIFKSLKAWPRIVLGIYEAELETAQAQKQKSIAKWAAGEPSDIAYERVGEAVELGTDRIKALCRQGRRHLKEGQPPRPRISVAQFRRFLGY